MTINEFLKNYLLDFNQSSNKVERLNELHKILSDNPQIVNLTTVFDEYCKLQDDLFSKAFEQFMVQVKVYIGGVFYVPNDDMV